MTLFSWPNVISALRIPLAAAFLAVDSAPARVGIVLAAGLSDWVDGTLARQLGWRTRSGELIDPVADKLFMLTVLSAFAAEGQLSVPELGVLLARDLYASVAFAGAKAFRLPMRFESRMSGKTVTVLQLAAVLALLVRPEWVRPLLVTAGAAGAVAIVDYTRAGLRSLRAPAVEP
jgi:phosphatidylglycerophosphate synthase